MKTKEELNALKEEVETLNKKLAELSKEELKAVIGGVKTKRKYFYLDDFEHRLLVGMPYDCSNEYIHEGKPLEDVNDLILKNIDAPSKKMRFIEKRTT